MEKGKRHIDKRWSFSVESQAIDITYWPRYVPDWMSNQFYPLSLASLD